MFIPLSHDPEAYYLVLVAHELPNTHQPDVSTLKIFKVSLRTTKGFNYKPGIWHHPMIAIGSDIDFMALVWERGSQSLTETEDTLEYYFENQHVFDISE
jgi:ureidoglycolate hydrolase